MRYPTQSDAFRVLRERGLRVSTVLDVGVQHSTPELISDFGDLPQVLFEPERDFADQIARNYEAVDHTLVQAAVCDTDGEVLFGSASLDGGDAKHWGSIGRGAPTPAVRLDTWLAANPRPGPYLLKIDVDGAELDVIAGSVVTLKQTSCVVIEAPLHTMIERYSALREHGFVLWDIIDLCYFHENLSQVDMIFLAQSELQNPGFRPWQNEKFAMADWQPADALGPSYSS